MPPSSDPSDIPHTPAQLRARIQQRKQADPDAWEATRRLVHPDRRADTLRQLAEHIRRCDLPATLREQALAGLETAPASASGTERDNQLKALTGLPATKALRALCVYFALVGDDAAAVTDLAPRDVETFAQHSDSPYALLLQAERPSALDLGAGDLSFADELIARYLPPLRQRDTVFTLHALDRLRPGSQLGGQYHASPERLRRLQHLAPHHLRFRFWGNVDMFALDDGRRGAAAGRRGTSASAPTPPPSALLARYTIVTCHAPATPTFAYEPTRLSPAVIQAHLADAKGAARHIRVDGEEALEVLHRGRRLTFPPWKFTIHGPLALLNLAARRGALCVFASVDDEVFWEVLAQLVDDPAMRPADVVFDADTRPAVFGRVYHALTALTVGERCRLSDLTPLRRALPAVPVAGGRHREAETPDAPPAPYRFRFVDIRRGAVFPDDPAGSTARQFSQMSEEAPPWQIVLVPEKVDDE